MTDMEKIVAALDDAQTLIPKLVAEIERLRAQLAQQRGEPVAWMDPEWPSGKLEPGDAFLDFAPHPSCGWIPLYAAPQPPAACAGCGKRDSDGWALYCVSCIDTKIAPQRQPVATLHRHPSIGVLRVTFEDAVTELADGTYPLYAAPQQRQPLQDAQIEAFWRQVCKDERLHRTSELVRALARAVEAYHQIGIKETK